MLWISFTLLAVLFQTIRTGLQKKLSTHMSTEVVTWIRAGFGLPFGALYLGCLATLGQILPSLSLLGGLFIVGAALCQMVGTYGMVTLFRKRNFSVSIAYSKAEALHTAILGVLVFGETLPFLGWVSVCLGVFGVLVLSFSASGVPLKQTLKSLSVKDLGIGTIAAIGFAFTSLFIRQAALLMDSSAMMNAASILFGVLLTQFLLLGAYILLRQPNAYRQIRASLLSSATVGLTSCLGSIGWFTAFALTNPAYVKTLGQIELVFSVLVSHQLFKERSNRYEMLGVSLTLLSILVLIKSQF